MLFLNIDDDGMLRGKEDKIEVMRVNPTVSSLVPGPLPCFSTLQAGTRLYIYMTIRISIMQVDNFRSERHTYIHVYCMYMHTTNCPQECHLKHSILKPTSVAQQLIV